MLPLDALAALDRLPAEEAIRRPIEAGDTPARRIAALLGGSARTIEPTTVGDVLFRWARTEPDAFLEADVQGAGHVSAILAATGRLPKRLGIIADLRRTILAGEAGIYAQFNFSPRSYMLSRLVAHLHEAQGCEAAIGGSLDDPSWVLVNGLGFAVQDPNAGPPSAAERLTMYVADKLNDATNLINNPLVYAIPGIASDILGSMLPAVSEVSDLFAAGLNISIYANAAARAARLVMQRETDALLKLYSLVSAATAGHIGHAAGHAAAVALFGLAGSWMVVLAPIASGFAGRVVARNLIRRARFLLICRNEVTALHDAIRRHCLASRDVLESNMRSARTQADQFAAMHTAANGSAKVVIADWLERIEYIQAYRRLVSSRLDRAISNPVSLDQRDGDPVAAAYESLLICARTGIHPANVARTADAVVAGSLALHRKMSVALI